MNPAGGSSCGRPKKASRAKLALLNGLSPDGRGGLILVLLTASLEQLAWVFAHLRGLVHSEWPMDSVPPTPLRVLEDAKLLLLREAVEFGLRAGDGNPPAAHTLPVEPQSGPVPALSTDTPVVDLTVDGPDDTGLDLDQPAFTAGAHHWQTDEDAPPAIPAVEPPVTASSSDEAWACCTACSSRSAAGSVPSYSWWNAYEGSYR